MSTASPEITTVKFHASLNVSNLEHSVAFYRILLNQEPARLKRNYAKFELEQPPVVLSLIPGPSGAGGNLNHVGLRIPSAEVLVQMQSRLEAAGIRTHREEGVECCHSKQTKFWVNDPDGTLWEIYVLHEEEDEEPEGLPRSGSAPNAFANNATRPAKRAWQHHLADGAISRVPHEDNSLHEVLLEGSANLHPDSFNLLQLLREVHRALRPGCEVRIHGLTADGNLKNPAPSLPGPAAPVQYVPAHSEVAHKLELAGFAGIRFERLSEQAHFVAEGVGMREFLLAGSKPGHRPQAKTHGAIYLGPLTSVNDDFGNTFARGNTVSLNIHDWQALSKSAAAAQFRLLSLARSS